MKRPFQFCWLSILPSPEQLEQPLDFLVVDGAAQADAVDVGDRHEHGRVVRHDAQMIEAAGRAEDGLLFDALDDAETVIRVDDLVADLKCHWGPLTFSRSDLKGRRAGGTYNRYDYTPNLARIQSFYRMFPHVRLSSLFRMPFARGVIRRRIPRLRGAITPTC